ncbi:MAG: signal peptidase II [Nanoarchaeota archaeon]|nr:signal peptidase II [Nanoarchaeota archaeon]
MKNISKAFILSAVTIFITDQISKYWIRTSSTNFIKNYGAGFGILQNQTIFLIIVSFAILAGIIYYYKKIPKTTSYQTFTGLVLGGLLGNLVDRLFFGYVIDFISIGFWPSFNIADSALSIGIIGLIIWIIREK